MMYDMGKVFYNSKFYFLHPWNLENNWETILNFWCWKAIKRNFNIWLQEYAHTQHSSHKVKRNIINKCLENFFYRKLKFLKWAPEYFFDEDENHFPVNKIISWASGHVVPTCIGCICISVVLENLINWNDDAIGSLSRKNIYKLLMVREVFVMCWPETHLIIMSFSFYERGELTASNCEIQCL